MDLLSEIRRPIEAELEDYRRLFERTLQTENPLLRVALSHLLQRRGKLMRPMLVLLSARYVGSAGEAVTHAAVALELLHTASLVHDDVVDESDRRRGQHSVNALLDNKVAVLVGDFLLSKALYHAAQTGSPEVVTWVAELGQTLSDGELLQLANTDSELFCEEAYYEVIEKKTASLFSSCARIGCRLAGGSGQEVDRMAEFGRQVGLCFQLRDDIFDYDKTNGAGKPTGNDLREGKLTLPVIYALSREEGRALRETALRVRRGEASEEETARLVALAHEQGGIAYAMWAMEECRDRALALIEKDRDPSMVESLSAYARFVADRSV